MTSIFVVLIDFCYKSAEVFFIDSDSGSGFCSGFGFGKNHILVQKNTHLFLNRLLIHVCFGKYYLKAHQADKPYQCQLIAQNNYSHFYNISLHYYSAKSFFSVFNFHTGIKYLFNFKARICSSNKFHFQ